MPTATCLPRPNVGDATGTFSRGEADDHVYPVHVLDGAKYQQCILTLFLRFNDILDPDKISQSLTRLLEIGDWKKLAGRFRTVDGNESHGSVELDNGINGPRQMTKALEIHVPRVYTAQRPAIRFAHEAWDSSVFDHPLGRQFPRTETDGVSLSPPLGELRLCGHAPGFPLAMADLVDKDAPQLCLKVISFTDATVVAITFSHCTWDISGLQGFMKSLELVLEGREDEVPPMLGARSDVLSELASEYHGSVVDPALLNLPKSVEAVGRQQPRVQVPKPALEERMLRVPLHVIQRLRDRATLEAGTEDEEDALTYQHDELLLALIVQQIARAMPVPCTLKLLNIFNLRLLVPCIANAKGIYSQNLVLPAPQILTTEAASGPMAPVALAQRECFARAAAPKNVTRSLFSILRAIEADLDITGLTYRSDEESVLVNSLVRASSHIDVDLSAAVVRQGNRSSTRRNGLGTADWCCLILPGNSYGMMRVTTLGSYNGNACWIIGELPARTWKLISETLYELEL